MLAGGYFSCLIDFVDNLNKREMIYHKGLPLQVLNKIDIICNILHELICNSVMCQQEELIGTAVEAWLEAILITIF